MSESSQSTSFVIRNALLAARLSKRVGNHLSAHGISVTEYLIMHHLYLSANKALPRIELAEYIGMSASGITRLLAPMEKINLVQKEANPRDARQSLVKLSQTGQQLYLDAGVSFEHIASSLLAGLSTEQLDQANEIFARLL
jgi:DNA-binding MarR family transcriptional regulator